MNDQVTESLPVDGRRLRTVRNRRKIVEALLQLVEAGNYSPSAEVVADKAGVGLRSVFRHFNDMESLYREIGEELRQRVAPLVSAPLEGETWREQLEGLLERKIVLMHECLNLFLVGRIHRHDSLYAKIEQQKMRELERRTLVRILPPEVLRDKELFEALDLAISVDSWARLRKEQGLSVRRSAAVVRRTLDALLRDFA